MEKNFAYPMNAFVRVRAKITWAQLEIATTKGAEFQLIIAGDDESVEELRVEQNRRELTVAQPQFGGYAKEIIPRRRWLQICVRIPAEWRGDVDADTITGPLSAYGFAGTDVALSTVSGAINVRNLQAQSLFLHTVSGTIAGNDLVANRTNLRGVSGKQALRSVQFGLIKSFTVSGDVSLDLLEGSRTLDMQSISGNMQVETNDPVNAALHSLSGRFLMEDNVERATDGFDISASSVSGDLSIKRRELA